MEERLTFPSLRAHMARTVFIPLMLALAAVGVVLQAPLGAPYDGWIAAGLALMALAAGVWQFILTTETLEVAVEQATLAVRHMASGEQLPQLQLPRMREPAELLIATQELQECLTVMVPIDLTETPEAEARDALDDLIARLRSTCDQLSDAAAPVLTEKASSVHRRDGEDSRQAEPIASRERVVALRQQAERLIQLASPFRPQPLGQMRRAVG